MNRGMGKNEPGLALHISVIASIDLQENVAQEMYHSLAVFRALAFFGYPCPLHSIGG